ncbi:MAG TPA: DUF1844 domain-containing protein [Pyrinomonadaceae bacterium]|nr:DUF1844 domain-containing protein [Pyrinomonadaceae bacterium]
MSEEQTSYKVTDRRLFNPDGTPREVPEDERPEPTPVKEAPVVATSSAESSAAANSVTAKPEETKVAKETQPKPASDQSATAGGDPQAEVDLPGAEDPASFASFMMSIASNAASSLGMMEHPVTGKREVDLELGKHWIDVLGMLQQKTRGNLLPQEQQILEGLLADLRMQYVSLTNATPKARTFSSRDITGG